ncbi:MAG TPA: alkaline phosphatase family protein [Thiobacillaceae bacterium]|nr:alkaline phosphatase family protein [Thiobacillaceae bacterium]
MIPEFRTQTALHGEPGIMLPDYCGGSLVNLMSSIAIALGADSPYPQLTLLPAEALADARHLVLLVVDGLGLHYLLGRNGALRRHLRGQLTSVFPSTTASAIPTFLTGLAPQQHALTGWHMYFREIGAIAAPLPFRVRADRHALRTAGVTPRELFGLTPLFDRLPLACHVVGPRHIIHSDFNVALSGRAQRHGYDSLDEMFGLIAGMLRSVEPGSYVYAYWPELDSAAHEHGIGSAQTAAAFAALDAAFAQLLEAARGSGSVVIVTADHGFIDTTAEQTVDLDDHPLLRQTLLLPLCGEPRAAYAYVRSGREPQLENYLREKLGDRVQFVRTEDVLRQGWLGPGEAHPALCDRLGDYVLLPRGNAILRDWLKGEERHTHVGVHGGQSEAEMLVPLVVVRLD